MASLNKILLIGNVGKIEGRQTNGGGSVANLSLATSTEYKDKHTGAPVKTTEWHNVVAFGKLADIILAYVVKGSSIYIEGKVKYEQYEKDGVTKYTTKIIAEQLQMLNSKKDRAPDNHNSQAMANPQPFDFGDPLPGDDSIPF